MSNKLLITLSQRNLLLNSSFIETTEPEIYSILKKNNTISYQIAKEESIIDKIKQNLSLWLDFSSKEWIPDKKNPRLINSMDDKKKKCQLCNTKIKFQYKIKNQKNDCVLIIGGNCVDSFKELKTMKKIVSNETEFKRYKQILEYNPYVYDILVTHIDILDGTKIILPHNYESSFEKVQKKVTKILRSYIKKDTQFNKQELDKLIIIHKNEVKNINKFVNEHIHDRNYLTRERANFIKNNQKEDFSEIINEVKENGGRLLPVTSIKIKIESYLEEMKIEVVKVIPDYFSIEKASYGIYFVSIRKFNDYYKFSVSSQLLLTEYYRKKIKNIDDVYERNAEKFIVHDSDTREKLIILAESFITDNREFRLKEIDYHNIVSRYDNDLNKEEYASAYEKVVKVMNNFTVIEKQGEVKLLIFSNSNLGNHGKNLLIHQTKNEVASLIESYEMKMYIDELYDFVIKQIG